MPSLNYPAMPYRLIFLLFLQPLFLFAQQPAPAVKNCREMKQTSSYFSPAADPRMDSIDLLMGDIHLILDAPPYLSGSVQYEYTVLTDGVWGIYFDLVGIHVDSVHIDGVNAVFYPNSYGTQIKFNAVQNTGPGLPITVYYSGTPILDATGWGGVYHQGAYFYNLGVGFDADPHNFGRAWYPCFDNFTERCAYRLTATTAAENRVFGCGTRLSEDLDTISQKLETVWEISDPIPSYLLCFASGPFTEFSRTLQGEGGSTPVQIGVHPSDSVQLANSFIHLPEAFACFEHWYGPYLWDKVGYSVVPFNAGAMEHATNIAYMAAAVDGTTSFETLMAHELSHHWWGDLATCSTAEDMWLNEGWASYSEQLFTEWVYGETAYLDAVQANFLQVLQNTHLEEGGYRAVSGVPHAYTYGSHVYDKGAVLAHNLRTYLGDSLFRAGLRTVLFDAAFSDWSSEELRDVLGAATGKNLDDFFDDWVFQPGFSHFQIDSFHLVSSPGNPDSLEVFVRQKLRGAEHFYNGVPLELCLVDADFNRTYAVIEVSGETDSARIPLQGAMPMFVWSNTRHRLSLARADKERMLYTAGNQSFTPAKLTINIPALDDSLLVRVEHHWAIPDTFGQANPNNYLFTNRYWTIAGNIPADFEGAGSIFYDGKGQQDELDAELFAQTSPSEDSILLAYRPGPGAPWMEHPDYQVNKLGSGMDKFGGIRIDKIWAGEYTIVKGVSMASSTKAIRQDTEVRLTPNPASDKLRIESDHRFFEVQIWDVQGKLIRTIPVQDQKMLEIQVNNLSPGAYQLVLKGKSGVWASGFVVGQ
jgi:aminopeptidase N